MAQRQNAWRSNKRWRLAERELGVVGAHIGDAKSESCVCGIPSEEHVVEGWIQQRSRFAAENLAGRPGGIAKKSSQRMFYKIDSKDNRFIR